MKKNAEPELPHGRPYLVSELHWKTVRKSRYETAVVPWGSTEAHNFHLPFSTDTLQVQAIASESARLAWEKGAKIVVLPAIPFGINTGQIDMKLHINMNPATQGSVLRDIAESLFGQGIAKILVLNGHGGNEFRPWIREIQKDHPNRFIGLVSWYTIMDLSEYFENAGSHGGEMETSLMLHLHPDLVLPLSEAGAGKIRHLRPKAFRQGWAWAPRRWVKATVDTGVGNPAAATVQKGKVYFEAVTRKISEFLIELDSCSITSLYEKKPE
jgi:creatinine amidohydrolase